MGTTPATVFVLDTSTTNIAEKENQWVLGGSRDYDEGLELIGKQGEYQQLDLDKQKRVKSRMSSNRSYHYENLPTPGRETHQNQVGESERKDSESFIKSSSNSYVTSGPGCLIIKLE